MVYLTKTLINLFIERERRSLLMSVDGHDHYLNWSGKEQEIDQEIELRT